MRNWSEQTLQERPTESVRQDASPLGVLGLDVALTSLVLLFLLDTSLPVIASLGAAWIGGAFATIGLLALFVAYEHFATGADRGA